jgi:hypothetical protein
VPTKYVYLRGTSFAATTDTVAVLTRLGVLDRMNEKPRLAINAMAYANGVFDIYRASPDVMVIAGEGAPARLLARCSGASPITGGSEMSAALAAALSIVFDEQLGSQVDKTKRQVFVDCAIKAFEPVSDADIKILIDSNFKPGDEVQKRMDAAYPGLSDRARECADAVQAPATE